MRTKGVVSLFVAACALLISRGAGAIPTPDNGACNDPNPGLYVTNSGTGVGLRGNSSNGIGVEGTSNNNDGMHAVSYHNSHSGIYAQNLASGGGGYGIYAGVGGTGQAVHGQNNNASGWAGYFDGRVWVSGGIQQPSDARLKRDIAELPYGLRDLVTLRPVTFKWKDRDRGEGRHLGFLAQDLQKVVPEMVDKNSSTGMLAVDYTALVPVLAKAIQEQHGTYQRLDARIATLEQRPVMSSMFSGGMNKTMLIVMLGALLFAVVRARRQRRDANAHTERQRGLVTTKGVTLLVVLGGVLCVSRGASATIATPDWGACLSNSPCLDISNTGFGIGLKGTSANGIGVEGTSSNNDGMHAVTYHNAHSAIYAQNLTASGGGYGIYASAGGVGQAVHGQNNNASGWAGYFDGRVWAAYGISQPSDARLKKDIADLPYGLRDLAALRAVIYKWKDKERGDGRHLGFLAQELQKVVPELVSKDASTGMLSVDYPALVPVLVKAIQEQQAIIQRQEVRIAALEQRPAMASMFGPDLSTFTAVAAIVAFLFVGLRQRRFKGAAPAHAGQP